MSRPDALSTEGGDVMRVRKTDRKVASTLSLQKAN
jgi:hypothetical protein